MLYLLHLTGGHCANDIDGDTAWMSCPCCGLSYILGGERCQRCSRSLHRYHFNLVLQCMLRGSDLSPESDRHLRRLTPKEMRP